MSSWFVTYGYGEVHRNLVIGAYPLDASDVAMLSMMRVDRILNLVEDDEYRPGVRDEIATALRRAAIAETRVDLVDLGRLPVQQLDEAVTTVAGWVAEGHRVYVHCRAGWQRSAAVAAGAVALLDDVSIEQALALVKNRKPSADPLPHQQEDLKTWWETRVAGR